MKHKYKEGDFLELNDGVISRVHKKHFPIEESPEYIMIFDIEFKKSCIEMQLYLVSEDQIKGVHEMGKET